MGILIDDGAGFDQPLIEKDDYCIFDIGENFEIRHRIKGVIGRFPKEKITDAFWEALELEGWHKINLSDNEDE